MHAMHTHRNLLHSPASWLALLIGVILAVIGINAIGTVSHYYAHKQTIWLVAAIVPTVLCLWPNPRWIGLHANTLCLFTLLLLVILIMPGMPRSIVPVRGGARCWIDLKLMMFQPAELAKVVFVITLAWYLRYRDSFRTWKGLIVPFVLTLVPVALLLKQPDLGTAVLFGPTVLIMLVAAGAKLRHIGILVGAGVLLVAINVAIVLTLPASMQILKPHQQDRILAMFSQEGRYSRTIGFQQDRAMRLIGAGGWFGYGEDESRTVMLANRLPHHHNDMVFVVVVNRWGMVGGLMVLSLYLLMLGCIVVAAGQCRDPFGRLAMVGIAGMLFTQTAINICTNIGLLPVTGITLPFISYGGSSLLATFASLGLVINFASHQPMMVTQPSFEFDPADPLTASR